MTSAWILLKVQTMKQHVIPLGIERGRINSMEDIRLGFETKTLKCYQNACTSVGGHSQIPGSDHSIQF